MAPPEHTLVPCCDEKSQVQAMDRTQPGVPLKKERAATLTHDYKRNGTTTLFAALNVLDGQVIGQYQLRHTHAEWLKFLKKIDRETPKEQTLHLVADNDTTHKHPAVALGRRNWLFSGSERAGRRAAAIQSLLATAKMNGLEPYAWLKDTLEKLPVWPYSRLDELLPLAPVQA